MKESEKFINYVMDIVNRERDYNDGVDVDINYEHLTNGDKVTITAINLPEELNQ